MDENKKENVVITDGKKAEGKTGKPTGKEKKVLNDAELDQLAKQAGSLLGGRPKVKIKIPKDPLNPKDDIVPVTVNGYTYCIKRGEMVEVPDTVADILENANYI